MRQAGVLAAAGIVALDEMVNRLVDDHAHARKLAEGLAEMKGLNIDPDGIKTNIVYFETTREDLPAIELERRLNAEGIKILAFGPRRLRAVTCYHITPEDYRYDARNFLEDFEINRYGIFKFGLPYFNSAQATAMASISIRKPLGNFAISTVVRAGGLSLKRLP